MNIGNISHQYDSPLRETPYSTRVLPPNQAKYRMNPVKMIRQEIPSKIQSSDDGSLSVNEVNKDTSGKISLNPMVTKRIKCVVQPISQSNPDLHHHQKPIMHQSSHTGVTAYSCESFLNRSIETTTTTTCDNCNQETTHLSHSSSYIINCPNTSYQNERYHTVSSDIDNLKAVSTSHKTEVCARLADTVPVIREPSEPNIEDSINSSKKSYECDRVSDIAVEPLRPTESIEQNLNTIDKLLEENTKIFNERCEKTNSTNNSGVITLGNVSVDVNEEMESSNLSQQQNKTNKNTASKKCTGSKKCDAYDNVSSCHKCDKKKFYDPEDIRKYMIRKRNERIAKAKEEKCKKNNEMLALKRKADVAKIANKARLLVQKDQHHSELTQAETASKNVKTPMKAKITTANKQIIMNSRCDIRSNDASNHLKTGKLNQFNGIEFEEHGNSEDHCLLDEYLKMSDQKNMKENEIKFLRETDSKKSSIDMQFSKSCSKPIVFDNEPVLKLSDEVNVLRKKNPFSFFNALKGKINLALNLENFCYEEPANETFPTLARKEKSRKSDKKKFRRRTQPIIAEDFYHILSRTENTDCLNLKSELTLSDLHLSPTKPSEQTEEDSIQDNNVTYAVIPRENVLRKTTENSNKIDLERTPTYSLHMTGVKPLTISQQNTLTPLCEKNSNVEKFSKFTPDCKLSLREQFVNHSKVNSKEMSFIDRNWRKDDGTMSQLRLSYGAGKSHDSLEMEINKLHDSFLNKNRSVEDLLSSINASKEGDKISLTNILLDLYDQMINNEDEKLSQILKKIQFQKEAVVKHLKSEVYALEIQKNVFRDNNENDNMKSMKKKQRAILLKVTKNLQELDKMKKSVTDTVEKRKNELEKQKSMLKQTKDNLNLKFSPNKSTKSESNNKTYLISNTADTSLEISSSSINSIGVENNAFNTSTTDSRNVEVIKTKLDVVDGIVKETDKFNCRAAELKDTATSPVHFNAGISIHVELDPEKLIQLRNSTAQVKIETTELNDSKQAIFIEPIDSPFSKFGKENSLLQQLSSDVISSKNKAIKIKRPLSPAVLSTSKKVFHLRRLSSSSDLTCPSLNDITTTDQSDVELRISALQEQLRQRKLEAEQLRREEKQIRKEKLKAKEQSLIKQLEAYDEYIQRLSKLLSESKNCLGVKKPLIKSSLARKSLLYPSSSDQQANVEDFDHDRDLKIVKYDLSNEHRSNIINIRDDDTDDTDKEQLRKADSGILIESEVTEPSENMDIRTTRSNTIVHNRHSSSESNVATELDVKTEEVPSSASTEKNDNLEMKFNNESNKVSGFLQLVNDLQSEVMSMSEQMYSSDFVEDVPEDIADTKSYESEIATNDNVTSLSIDEIISDRQDDGSNDELENRSNVIIPPDSLLLSVDTNHDINTDQSKEASLPVSLSITGENSVIRERSKTETHSSDDNVHSNITKDVKVYEETSVKIEHFDEPVTTEYSDLNCMRINETSSEGEVSLANVKNVSDIESLPELDDTNLANQTVIQNESLSEGEITRDTKQNIEERSDSIIEEIKSVSSLESLSTDVNDEQLSGTAIENNTSNLSFDSSTKTNPELIRLHDNLNESEDSNAADIDEPVIYTIDDIRTIVDDLSISFKENASEKNDCKESLISDEKQRSSMVEQINKNKRIIQTAVDNTSKRNFDQVLVNLQSYFNESKIKIPATRDDLSSTSCVNLMKADSNSKQFVEYVSGIIADPEHREIEYSKEETDISESLEYDVEDSAKFNEKPYQRSQQVTDLDEDNEVKLNESDVSSIPTEYSDKEARIIGESNSVHRSESSTSKSKKFQTRETSREEDRSVEEFFEDYSVPDVEGQLFSSEKSHEITESEKSFSKNEREINDEYLTEKISKDQTPFLQALTHEHENLTNKSEEITEDMKINAEESCSNLTNMISHKMNDSDQENIEPVNFNSKIEDLINASDENKTNESPVNDWLERNITEESRLREAEELRLQQLRIEKEIEELQSQQHISSYFYFREIPNKPPPPYTPPYSENTLKIPSNEDELRAFIVPIVKHVCNELDKGVDIQQIQRLPNYSSGSKSDKEVQMCEHFIFDLAKEIADNILDKCRKKDVLPWEELSADKIRKPVPKNEDLVKMINDEILVLCGINSRITKENLIIQWSRKKHVDFVDDLLIRELQEEEDEWTNYEEDEIIIKNQITQTLLDELIQDTAYCLDEAFRKNENQLT